MGRITLFTADGSADCVRVMRAFQKLSMPYIEINVTQYPEKLKDMKALTDRWTTPQVFFNTRYIGGADETMALLYEWTSDQRYYQTPYERYVVEISSLKDPTNPRLSVPESPDVSSASEDPSDENHAGNGT
jgi:glutaredoxin